MLYAILKLTRPMKTCIDAGMVLHVHKLQVKDMIDKAAAENEGCEKLPLVRLKVS